MSDKLIYSFTNEDIKEVINFCKSYHLEETKKGAAEKQATPFISIG